VILSKNAYDLLKCHPVAKGGCYLHDPPRSLLLVRFSRAEQAPNSDHQQLLLLTSDYQWDGDQPSHPAQTSL